VANDKWALFEALPDGLDVADAVIYQETADAPAPRLGSRWAVFPDQVWRQRPDGQWQRDVATPADIEGTPSRWEHAAG
jgi:hypothetical protein